MKILVLEDNPDVRNVLKKFLQNKKCDVDIAITIREARLWLRVERNTYNICFLDNNLPDGTTVEDSELLEMIREQDPKPYVVLMTGKPPDIEASELHDLGIDTLLIKPFSLEKIGEIIEGAGRV